MINWKLRIKNKATLLTLISAFVAFIYQFCGIAGIVPPVSENEAIQAIGVVINLLAAFGIIVDPTTAGVNDSDAAMYYEHPRGGDE